MSEEKIQIVDENDRPVGSATRQQAWVKGLYHRLVQIVLEDEDGAILLQKRSANKAILPGRWTNAAGGHVDEGETYEEAAAREMNEEVGITATLEFIGTFRSETQLDGKKLNRFYGVFRGRVPHGAQFTLDPEEVSEIRWFTREELNEKIIAAPEEFTPAMIEVIKRYYNEEG